MEFVRVHFLIFLKIFYILVKFVIIFLKRLSIINMLKFIEFVESWKMMMIWIRNCLILIKKNGLLILISKIFWFWHSYRPVGLWRLTVDSWKCIFVFIIYYISIILFIFIKNFQIIYFSIALEIVSDLFFSCSTLNVVYKNFCSFNMGSTEMIRVFLKLMGYYVWIRILIRISIKTMILSLGFRMKKFCCSFWVSLLICWWR